MNIAKKGVDFGDSGFHWPRKGDLRWLAKVKSRVVVARTVQRVRPPQGPKAELLLFGGAHAAIGE